MLRVLYTTWMGVRAQDGAWQHSTLSFLSNGSECSTCDTCMVSPHLHGVSPLACIHTNMSGRQVARTRERFRTRGTRSQVLSGVSKYVTC